MEDDYTGSFAVDNRFRTSSARATLLAGGNGSSAVALAPAPAPAAVAGAGAASSAANATTTTGGTSPGRLPATGGNAGLRAGGLVMLAMGGGLAWGRSRLLLQE